MLMCILNLPTVLRMSYHQLATYIKTRNVPKGIALRPQRICDTDEKYN